MFSVKVVLMSLISLQRQWLADMIMVVVIVLILRLVSGQAKPLKTLGLGIVRKKSKPL